MKQPKVVCAQMVQYLFGKHILSKCKRLQVVQMNAFWQTANYQILAVAHPGMETGISEASKRVPIFSFATQGGKQASSYLQKRNWVQAREAQIRFPAG